MNKIKAGIRRLQFFWLAVALLSITTYVLYKVAFTIPTENMMQEFLLFINPISSSILLLGIALLFKNKTRNVMVVVLSFIGSFILYGNLLFYRFYSDFLTLPVLLQTNNMQDLSSSVFELMSIWDLFLFANVAILAVLVARKKSSCCWPVKERARFNCCTCGLAIFRKFNTCSNGATTVTYAVI